jgi:hypothetical protein
MPGSAIASASPAGSSLDSPEFTGELLAALEEHIPLEDYLAARAMGISDDEITSAFQVGFPIGSYATARLAGATEVELTELYTQSHTKPVLYTLDHVTIFYASARKHDITHAEFIESRVEDVDPGAYVTARNTGATHQEVMEADGEGGLATYTILRRRGLDHVDVITAYRLGIAPDDYAIARKDGMTHAEIFEADYVCASFAQYLRYKAETGATHQEVMAAVKEHDEPAVDRSRTD